MTEIKKDAHTTEGKNDHNPNGSPKHNIQTNDRSIKIKETDLDNTMDEMHQDKDALTNVQELFNLQNEVNNKIASKDSSTKIHSTFKENNSNLDNSDPAQLISINSFEKQDQIATKPEQLSKAYQIVEYVDQPKTSTNFVSYVKAGEPGNEIIGGLVKNGPYKGQYLFTANSNFTGTIIMPEQIKSKQSKYTSTYSKESISFLNGKVISINSSKPSSLKIHRAHLKDERNNNFQRNKKNINKFIIDDAYKHKQQVTFLADLHNSQYLSTEQSPNYIVSLDQESHQKFIKQRQTFFNKIPIINKIFKYNYEKSLLNTQENLINYFVDHPENFNITLRAKNKDGKVIEISLNNLYNYNDSFYNKVGQFLSSSTTRTSFNTSDISEVQIPASTPISNSSMKELLIKSSGNNTLNSLNKIITGLLPSVGLVAIATATIATDGIIYPIMGALLGTAILTNKQLIPNSLQLINEGMTNLMPKHQKNIEQLITQSNTLLHKQTENKHTSNKVDAPNHTASSDIKNTSTSNSHLDRLLRSNANTNKDIERN